MLLCLDSSALIKLLVEEDGSHVIARLWDDADVLVASRLVVPEVAAALHAARRNQRLDDDALARALTAWAGYRPALRLVELTSSLALQAAELTVTSALSGADAVHLASALTLKQASPLLAVWDRRLHAAARAEGVRTAPAAL
ncbi:MAG: type II toxin-antitoxin system VapC family toxin [Mycobacteriales bacterium]